MAQELLTVKETAERLRISVTSTYKMVQTGAIPRVKIANQWRVPADLLDEWLQKQIAGPDK